MLQVAERSSGVKRKALLVSQVPPTDTVAGKKDAFEQTPFPGAAFDRMRADPELMRARQRLFYGVATVGVLILIALLWSVFSNWGTPLRPVPEISLDEPILEETSRDELPRQRLPPMLSQPLDFEQIVKDRQSELAGSSVAPVGE